MAVAEPETLVRTAVVRAEAVSKRYGSGDAATLAVNAVSLAVLPGEFVALMGRSGCGKTTLLNLLGAMDLPTAGRIWLAGQDTAELSDDALTALRRRTVGFVFQAFHLLPTLTVAENIAVPLRLAGQVARPHRTCVALPLVGLWPNFAPRQRAPASAEGVSKVPHSAGMRVRELAERLGIAARLNAYPHQLSGGEAQRAALARALVHRPALVVADEPTGNLDTHAAAAVIELLGSMSREQGAAVVMATHSAEAAAHADRTLNLRDGALVPGN